MELGHISECARRGGCFDQFRLVMRRHVDDWYLQSTTANQPRRLEPGHVRHVDIGDDDVRSKGHHGVDELGAGGHGADDAEFAGEKVDDAFQEGRKIVSNKHTRAFAL